MAKTAIETKHSASYAQLLAMLTQVAGNIAFEKANVTNAYKALIGELGKTTGENPVDHTVVSYIAEKIAEVNSAAGTLAEQVEANKDAIDLLNDAKTVEGSVDYKIDQAFNEFATKMSDDKVVNTFKELVDYVATHQTEYTSLGALVGSLPADAGVTTVVAYAEKLAAAEKTRAEGAEKALSDRLDIIEGEETQAGSIKKALKDAKDYADGLAGNYDENGAAAAVQGETENTVKDLEDAINGFSYLTDEEVDTIKALFPIA